MSGQQPVFDQVNLVVADMDASLAFYRQLGLTIPDAGEWPPGSGARHADATMPNGVHLELDNHEMVGIWYPGWHDEGGGSRGVINFSLGTRDAVDALYTDLTGAGYPGRHSPHDAFWGSRYAIVRDPDGNDVGLMSPPDQARRFVPKP
jgi:catechol 2,3-dioxygenase-like lactoylglutathione lyase family enzyme